MKYPSSNNCVGVISYTEFSRIKLGTKLKVLKSSIPRTDYNKRFCLCLAKDLRSMGIDASIRMKKGKIDFNASLPNFSQAKILRLMKVVRNRQLEEAASFIKKMERNQILDVFIDGCELKIEKIAPRIHICTTLRDFEIFNYCRCLQSVPSTKRIGRQIRALVYDEGQGHPVLMGAIGLASSIYTVGCRDRYLGWIGTKAKVLKDSGLKRLMDLALCIAFPPYSFLLGGKLIALLAMTDPFRIEFQRKYGTSLLGLITTCATGVHCPIFNRIMIRKGGLFRRIGETAGYSMMMFRSNTMRSARMLVENLKGVRCKDLASWPKPIRILRQALRVCGIPSEPLLRLGNPKGVYFGVLSADNLVSLRTGDCRGRESQLSVGDAFEYWKVNILSKRRLCLTTAQKIRSFSRKKLEISRTFH